VPDVSAVREVFRRNAFCVIATASPAGEPWLSPVFFNYDPQYAITWESAHDALHSQYLRTNPRIAIFIKDTSTKAPAVDIYAEATAVEVPADRLAAALHTWSSGPHGHSDRASREVADYSPDRPMRLYQARIDHLYVREETLIGDYRVDVRVEVDLAQLRQQM
jgi:hypothetical protein